MAVPDTKIICEVMLATEGFSESRRLAPKVLHLFKNASNLLSKQKHYDWGLRAMKPRLIAAGVARRNEPEIDEETILMRTLQNLTVPSLVADDIAPFNSIVADLFSATSPNSGKVSEELENSVNEVCKANGLQPEKGFLHKIRQLYDSFMVRQSVFIIGPPACGKSEIWKTLAKAQNVMGMKTEWSAVDPKSLSTSELYGTINPTTTVWQDGVLVQLIRPVVSHESAESRCVFCAYRTVKLLQYLHYISFTYKLPVLVFDGWFLTVT
jgi:dynein heavy chain